MTIANGQHEPIIDKCVDCGITVAGICLRHLQPESMWRSGTCPSATHMRKQQTPEQKKRAGQQHQQKAKQLSKKQQESYKRLG